MKRKLSLSILVICIALCGCGRDKDLDEYKENMEAFFAQAELLNGKINAIDPHDENASRELLGYLDELLTAIDEMAACEVPEQFNGVETLAGEASENMQEAVRLFHEAYESGKYQENVADAALQYYERVNIRLHYIVSILHGEVPEDSAEEEN